MAAAVIIAGAGAGCSNPFDPLTKSDKIQGLTYFDFAATQEHWDADPEWDGVQIVMSYYNENSDALEFHDKPHQIQVEIYTEVPGATATDPKTRGSLLGSKTLEFSNSDDDIRIPIELYGGSLSLPSAEAILGCVLVRVFPPQEYPQKELFFMQCGVEIYTPETGIL